MIKRILNRKEFEDHPPVLLDVGASGELHKEWEPISKYSICLAFDADDRDMHHAAKGKDEFRELKIIQSIVSNSTDGTTDFFLTKAPYCSSSLEPYTEKLRNYYFNDLFEIEKKVTLQTIRIRDAIKDQGVNKIDWIKLDTQGTDLRLFKDLGEQIINTILVADFEPGLIDAYKGEDKFYHLLSYMNDKEFWISDLEVRGTPRVNRNLISNKLDGKILKYFIHAHKDSPGWVAATYLNSFRNINEYSLRDILLGWVISIMKKQYGFALELSTHGAELFEDGIFEQLEKYALKKIKKQISSHRLSRFESIPKRIFSTFSK